jgi:DNA adenine methylase
MTIRPPVKWHGGKFYLAKWIAGHFPKHRIYLEPFGGGASVLLNKPPVEVEVYNDIDRRITRLFHVLRDDGATFAAKASLTLYSQPEFEEAAEYPPEATDLDKALCDFIRWRQSFGGQGSSWSFTKARARGGMAGDVNAWWTAIDQLPAIIDRIRRVQIICQSAFEAIPKFDHPDALIYCDPPYVHSTREENSRAVYHAEMNDDDHRRLASVLRSCKAKVVLSGYPSPLYLALYADWKVVTREIANHAAGGRQKGREVECLWMNFCKQPAQPQGKECIACREPE